MKVIRIYQTLLLLLFATSINAQSNGSESHPSTVEVEIKGAGSNFLFECKVNGLTTTAQINPKGKEILIDIAFARRLMAQGYITKADIIKRGKTKDPDGLSVGAIVNISRLRVASGFVLESVEAKVISMPDTKLVISPKQLELLGNYEINKYEGKLTMSKEQLFRNRNNREQVYDETEVAEIAQFPGGLSALSQFLGENITYPKKAQELNIQGKVKVYFIVEKNGSISNIEVVDEVHPLLDMEAVRAVSIMPRWIPGKLNDGTVIRQSFTLPVNFKFTE